LAWLAMAAIFNFPPTCTAAATKSSPPSPSYLGELEAPFDQRGRVHATLNCFETVTHGRVKWWGVKWRAFCWSRPRFRQFGF
jgi:hypothetical protein